MDIKLAQIGTTAEYSSFLANFVKLLFPLPRTTPHRPEIEKQFTRLDTAVAALKSTRQTSNVTVLPCSRRPVKGVGTDRGGVGEKRRASTNQRNIYSPASSMNAAPNGKPTNSPRCKPRAKHPRTTNGRRNTKNRAPDTTDLLSCRRGGSGQQSINLLKLPIVCQTGPFGSNLLGI